MYLATAVILETLNIEKELFHFGLQYVSYVAEAEEDPQNTGFQS